MCISWFTCIYRVVCVLFPFFFFLYTHPKQRSTEKWHKTVPCLALLLTAEALQTSPVSVTSFVLGLLNNCAFQKPFSPSDSVELRSAPSLSRACGHRFDTSFFYIHIYDESLNLKHQQWWILRRNASAVFLFSSIAMECFVEENIVCRGDVLLPTCLMFMCFWDAVGHPLKRMNR